MSASTPVAFEPRAPEMDGILGPAWFHHHGSKMRLSQSEQGRSLVRIEGSAAWLQITPVAIRNDEGWYIDWEIRHSLRSKVSGRVVFQTPALRAAFRMYDAYSGVNQWLIDRFGADCAEKGQYIRYQQYLNIPGPGTGHDGDANISIVLDEQITDAARQLLVHRQFP